MHRAHTQAITACRIRDGILATPEEVTRALRALAEYLATVPEPYAETEAAPPETVTAWQCPRCGAAYGMCGRSKCASPGYCDGLCCECERGQSRTHGENEADPCQLAVCGHCGWRGRMPTAADPRDARIADLEEQLRRRTCERDEAVSVSAEWRSERHEYARIAESYRRRVAQLERVVEAARAYVDAFEDHTAGRLNNMPTPAMLTVALHTLDRGAA